MKRRKSVTAAIGRGALKEGKMGIKAFQIRNAVTWLKRFEAKSRGEKTYVNPQIYTIPFCKQIIDAVNDVDLQDAGIPIKEARRLAAEVGEA